MADIKAMTIIALVSRVLWIVRVLINLFSCMLCAVSSCIEVFVFVLLSVARISKIF